MAPQEPRICAARIFIRLAMLSVLTACGEAPIERWEPVVYKHGDLLGETTRLAQVQSLEECRRSVRNYRTILEYDGDRYPNLTYECGLNCWRYDYGAITALEHPAPPNEWTDPLLAICDKTEQ